MTKKNNFNFSDFMGNDDEKIFQKMLVKYYIAKIANSIDLYITFNIFSACNFIRNNVLIWTCLSLILIKARVFQFFGL